MERRSWPWKKKSSEKSSKSSAAADALDSSPNSTGSPEAKEKHKKLSYVQISVESYKHLTGLEEQVKSYEEEIQALEDQIKELNENLQSSRSEVLTKENITKQHAKVAEEAVSGWEKAEAEAAALKGQLESVMLLKLTAEERVSQLDGALRECMRQIRNMKEEHELKVQDLVHSKNKQLESLKLELETKVVSLEQELLRSTADNAAIARTLQERTGALIKSGEEKSQAEAEAQVLKSNIDSCEREIQALKYETHVLSKELEIRNEEKNMSMRSVDIANKQHLEDAKKISRLEADCQRLRLLVRKKLPGPAAVAQMKQEVESLGHDSARRSSVSHNHARAHASEFSVDNAHKLHKENELLKEELSRMEEEANILRDALSKRNTELQASKNLCAKNATRVQALESQLMGSNSRKSSLDRVDHQALVEGSVNPQGSKNGNARRSGNSSHLDFMDDFLEMERLASLSAAEAESVTISDSSSSKALEIMNVDSSEEHRLIKPRCEEENRVAREPSRPLMQLRARIPALLVSLPEDADMEDIVKNLNQAIQETHDRNASVLHCPKSSRGSADGKKMPLFQGDTVSEDESTGQEMAAVVTQLHDFALMLSKEVLSSDDLSVCSTNMSRSMEKLTATFNRVLHEDTDLKDFVFDLSRVVFHAVELGFNFTGYKSSDPGTSSPDYIDKIALPENKVSRCDSLGGKYHNGCTLLHYINPDVPDEGSPVPGFEMKSESIITDLTRCTKDLEAAKTEVLDKEKLLAEINSQLAAAEKESALSSTQLKCMVESYRSLEKHAGELEDKVKLLRDRVEALELELENEKKNCEEARVRCKELEDLLSMKEGCTADPDIKNKQEKELAVAAGKLAECQETIFLLGKQLKAFCPQQEPEGCLLAQNSRALGDRPLDVSSDTLKGKNMEEVAPLFSTSKETLSSPVYQ